MTVRSPSARLPLTSTSLSLLSKRRRDTRGGRSARNKQVSTLFPWKSMQMLNYRKAQKTLSRLSCRH